MEHSNQAGGPQNPFKNQGTGPRYSNASAYIDSRSRNHRITEKHVMGVLFMCISIHVLVFFRLEPVYILS